jgi:hypothetical protein
MNRRKFLCSVVAGAAGATAGIVLAKTGLGKHAAGSKESRVVTYAVKGFTCVTCATGLEVMLLRLGDCAGKRQLRSRKCDDWV